MQDQRTRVEGGNLLLNSNLCVYSIKFHEARQKKTTRELLAEKFPEQEFREFQPLRHSVETQKKSCFLLSLSEF